MEDSDPNTPNKGDRLPLERLTEKTLEGNAAPPPRANGEERMANVEQPEA